DGGELLEDEPYAPWAQGPRRRAARLQRRARSCVWTAALDLGDTAAALDAATAAVDADPFDEDAHRALMRANHRRGDRGAALVVFKRLERELHDELGVAPADETLELYEAIAGGGPEPEVRRPGVGPGGGGLGGIGGTSARRAPLVGRRQELYLLREAWAGAVAGRCAFVFVSGPAGSGKSRLAAETAAVAEAAGGVTLRARCNEAERSLFLQPIVEAVRGHLETVTAEVAGALVGSWAGTLGELLPGLTVALGPGGAPAYERAGPELEHRRSLEAVTEFFTRLAQRQPVLLVLDDLEHAGASTLEALRFMAGRLAQERLLVVVTLRPEEAREAMETLEHLGREIHLGPLPVAAVEQLAAAMGVPELAGPVFELTGGDVLFSVEAFRLAADSDRAADALEVSRSLREVVTERVRRAGDDVEEFLRVGVVAGASFDLDLVARVQEVAAEAAARLAQRALEAGLLTSKGGDLTFANSVIQEVLYETTPPAVRASRHRRIAELVADRPELVAVHREAAGDWKRACEAWTVAATDARRRFANRDAERLFGRAVAAAAAAGDDAAEGRVSLRRGQVREELADYAGAREDHQRALALARALGDSELEAMALERLGWTAYYGRDVDRAADFAVQATALAEAAAAAPGAQASALVLVGRVRHWAGDMSGAAAAYEQAMTDGESEPATVASALSCLGALLEHGDRFAEARDVLARAMATCEETGSFRALLRTLFFAGLARANLGDLVGALRVLERKRGLLNRYDVHFYRARTSTTLSWVWRELGDVARAEDLAQEAIEQSREVAAGSLQTEQELHALLAAAECRLLDGDEGSAAALVAEAEPLIRVWLPFRWRAELRLIEVASRLEPARAELLLDLARQRGSAKYQALALARLGHR
ncbi:MAG TPA: AAA family ATPase, partial [Acidimicrobiales bacterium]